MIRKEVTKMDIGVSTACLYPLETEKALYELAKRLTFLEVVNDNKREQSD